MQDVISTTSKMIAQCDAFQNAGGVCANTMPRKHRSRRFFQNQDFRCPFLSRPATSPIFIAVRSSQHPRVHSGLAVSYECPWVSIKTTGHWEMVREGTSPRSRRPGGRNRGAVIHPVQEIRLEVFGPQGRPGRKVRPPWSEGEAAMVGS